MKFLKYTFIFTLGAIAGGSAGFIYGSVIGYDVAVDATQSYLNSIGNEGK